MKSKEIAINNKGLGMTDALNEVEGFAENQKLSHKQALRLRLLGEEMLGMAKEVIGDFSAKFWVEGNADKINLHLEALTVVDMALKDELLALSSNGKNIAARGVMGKMRDLFETYMLAYEEVNRYAADNGLNLFPYDEFDMMHAGMDLSSHYWSLQKYRTNIEEQAPANEAAAQAWDEMEKSIVGKLADDVLVGIRSGKVEMIIGYTPK